MYDLVLLYLEHAKKAPLILPSIDTRLYVSTALFIVSSFIWYGFRAVRDSDRIASLLFKSPGNDRRMLSRMAWLNTSAMVAFTLYLLAFVLSRVKLCQAPATVDEEGLVFKPSECTRLTVWFQPSHLLLARVMLEIVIISFSLFWVLYKQRQYWSTFRLVTVLSAMMALQIMESGSVLYYDSESYRKSKVLSVTSRSAAVLNLAILVLSQTTLSKWTKAFAQPIIVLHPEKNIWYPNDEVQLDDIKSQHTFRGSILTYHCLYHIYIDVATWGIIPIDLADPYSLSHNFMLVFLGSLLTLGYLSNLSKMALDKRLNDPNVPPEGRLPFILVLKEDRVVACTAVNRAELNLDESSPEQLFTDPEDIELKTEDLV